MNPPALHSQIQSALQCLTSTSTAPETITQAQAALLQWEEHHTDEYVTCLLSLIGCSAATIRLAAMLSLKAATLRRWKDRGRGKLSKNGGTAQPLLCDAVKHAVRQSILQLLLSGYAPTLQDIHQMISRYNGSTSVEVNYISSIENLSQEQVEIIRDNPLQMNAAALLSKIGRMDLPLKFHELIPSLVSGIQISHEKVIQYPSSIQMIHRELFRTVQFNVMCALEALLAEMSTQRLLVDKKFRIEISKLYLGKVIEFALIPALEFDLSNDDMGLKYAIITSRVVSYLMVSSFSKLVEESSTAVVVEHTLSLTHKFLDHWLPRVICEAAYANRSGLLELLSTQCNIIVELQSNHSSAFEKYTEHFLGLFYTSFIGIVENESSIGSSLDTIAIAFLLFTANVVSSADDDATIWERFFTASCVQSLTRQVLLLFSCHLFANSANASEHDGNDRESWHDSPEAFYLWELQRSSEDNVGCAAQNLFLALIETARGKEVITPWLIGLLQNVSLQQAVFGIEVRSSAAHDPQTLLASMPLGHSKACSQLDQEIITQYDAIYTALGLAGEIMESEAFSFDSWFNTVLGPGLTSLQMSKENRLPVIQRRLIWLLSCNAHRVDISCSYNPVGLLVSTLTDQNDLCVRLTAVQALEALLPFCEERNDLLQSIVEPAIPALYVLTSQCEEVENRTICLELVCSLITYVKVSGGELSDNMLNTIAAPLPALWKNAIDKNLLLKRNVLGILSVVASYVGQAQASILHPMSLPMIDNALQSADCVFLVEDALKLWFVFLRLSTACDSNLASLFVHAARLSKELEHTVMLTKIAELYINFGEVNFLSDHAVTLQAMLVNLVGEVSPRGQAYVSLVTEALLKRFPSEGSLLLLRCGILKKFVDAYALFYSDSKESEPDCVIILYLTTLARAILASPELSESCDLFVSGGIFGVHELISLYVSKFRAAGNGPHGLLFQKLWAMLLLSFYPPSKSTSCSSAALHQSSQIFQIFSYILKNVDENGSKLLQYEVHFDAEDKFCEGYEFEIDDTDQSIANNDVVVETNFLKCLSVKMSGLADALGPDAYQRFIGNIDSAILDDLTKIMNKA